MINYFPSHVEEKIWNSSTKKKKKNQIDTLLLLLDFYNKPYFTNLK